MSGIREVMGLNPLGNPAHLHELSPGFHQRGLQPLSSVRRMLSWQMFTYSDAQGKVTRHARERAFTQCAELINNNMGKIHA